MGSPARTADAQPARGPSDAAARLRGLVEALALGDPSAAVTAARARVKALEPAFDARERPSFERALALLDELEPAAALVAAGEPRRRERDALLRAAFAHYSAWLRDFASLYPDDPAVQKTWVSLLGALPALADAFDLTSGENRAAWSEARARAEALVVRWPRDAEAHALRCALCDAAGDELATCLALFSQCRALELGEDACGAGYDAVVRDFAQPFCAGADIAPDVAFFAASTRVRAGVGTISASGETLTLEAAPAFSHGDVLALEATPDGTRIRFNAAGAARFAAWANGARGDRALRLVVLRADRPLAAARVAVGAHSPFALLGLPLASLCLRTERRAWPADLGRPAASSAGPAASPSAHP